MIADIQYVLFQTDTIKNLWRKNEFVTWKWYFDHYMIWFNQAQMTRPNQLC